MKPSIDRKNGTIFQVVPMTGEETNHQCANLSIDYSFTQCPFGQVLIAFTGKGLCSILLAPEKEEALKQLRRLFPASDIREAKVNRQPFVAKLFDEALPFENQVCLHLKGTPFQLQVWKALLEIPFGKTSSYGAIASHIGHPKACRAVGSAVGKNPLFYLIPCHRVLPSDGSVGNYFWGPDVKKAILDWESAVRRV
ncbi:MAG: methylated-DNA--[protein]-cysteine S-methyltransferase [Bacteroidota bacterium]|nr:methylated-DNA--[protein]-cysteine S-methyltransferase [Bacteroidota bacterium]